MAGPVCQLLLSEPLRDTDLGSIDQLIDDTGELYKKDGVSEWHFWIKTGKIIKRKMNEKGCLFSVYAWNGLTAEYGASYDIPSAELQQIQAGTGFIPRSQIALNAGCNGDIDHRLMARLASHFLELFGGFIDFGGRLQLQETVDHMPGKLFPVTYEIDKNRNGIYHIADLEFLDSWINHPNFRMIK
jgi:hypothetical protein